MSIESADNILHVKNSTMRISRVEVGQTLSVGNIEFENTTTLTSVTSNGNNTTPYTISSSNVTTGLATTANVDVGGELTVTGNTTVTGDLNVSGALGILNAIYPVGTVIDRATAITDTHPNGKYKAFLAAPNQEWELTKSPQSVVTFSAHFDNAGGTTSLGYNTLIPFSNVVFGSNVFNSTTSEFTVPAAGKYLFSCSINPGPDDNFGFNVHSKLVGQSSFSLKRHFFNNSRNEHIVDYRDVFYHACILDCALGEKIALFTKPGYSGMDISDHGTADSVTIPRFLYFEGASLDVEGIENYKYKRTA